MLRFRLEKVSGMRAAVWKLQEPGTRVCVNMDLKSSAEISGSVDTEEVGEKAMTSRAHTVYTYRLPIPSVETTVQCM